MFSLLPLVCLDVKFMRPSDESISFLHCTDHGNAEKMLADDHKSPHTAHTTNRVPFIMTSTKHRFLNVHPVGTGEGDGVESTGGALCDVAPTILDVMGLPLPKEMSGVSLIDHAAEAVNSK